MPTVTLPQVALSTTRRGRWIPYDQRPEPWQLENLRAELVQAVNTIVDHRSSIAGLASGRGLVRSGDGQPGSPNHDNDPVGDAAMSPDAASDWLVEMNEASAALRRVAQRAVVLDPPKAKNTRGMTGVIEVCVKCGLEIGQGVNGRPDCRRVNGHPLHGDTCYYVVYRAAKADGQMLGFVVERLVEGRRGK